MNYGYIKVAAANTYIKVADCFYNASKTIDAIKEAYENNVSLIVFPELSITGYTCSDLFFQTSLLKDSKIALERILEETKDLDITIILGMPIEYNSKLFNCGVCIHKGEIKGIIPKTHLPNYSEFYERRQFNEALLNNTYMNFLNQKVLFGTKIIFNVKNIENFKFGIEVCEDLWAVIPPSSNHALAGAILIANLSASNETVGKSEYREELVKNQSARCICGYIYSSSGDGESTTDLVFSGNNLIFEDGRCLAKSEKFKNSITYSEIDLDYLSNERKRNTTFILKDETYDIIEYEMNTSKFELTRFIDKTPFVPESKNLIEKRCKEIIDIQAYGLKKRLEHIGTKHVVIGVSGGLDSTYALIVLNRTFEILNYDKKNIISVIMPCFGTTDRTYKNGLKLCEEIGSKPIEINIKDSVLKHFQDIGHDKNIHDVTFENSQARERTQVLMDLANKFNGIVIGTGDLSELALGFATYNGDHMSMYSVNCSIPKTLIKYLIEYYAKISKDNLKTVLEDILATPVSPELLPPSEQGHISQITEDIVGPYHLHDFFLYNMIRNSYSPEKIYFLAKKAFENMYSDEEILKWLEKFYTRFFSQQFKRSCMPDGPKVGSVSLSPRGDFRMPSDASVDGFLKNIKKLNKGAFN